MTLPLPLPPAQAAPVIAECVRVMAEGLTPMRDARYRIVSAGQTETGITHDGWVRINASITPTGHALVEWGPFLDVNEAADAPYPYGLDVTFDTKTGTNEERAVHMLRNLGYAGTLAQMVTEFQSDHKLDETGLDGEEIPTKTWHRLEKRYETALGAQSAPRDCL